MIDFSLLKPQIYQIVSTLVNIPVIWDRQSGPEPAKPYATLRLSDLNQVFRKELTLLDETTGSRELRVTYSIDLTVTSLGDNANSYSQKIDFSMSKESVQDAFQAIGLFYYDKDKVKDVPQLLSTKWEDRAIQKIHFYVVDSEVENPGWIESFELEATYTDVNDNPVIQHTEIVNIVTP